MSSSLRSRDWIENRPSRGIRWPNLRELWEYRELLFLLAQRDVRVRYKQAVFGATWALLQPLAGVVVFTLVFRRFARVPSGGIPYPVFALAGLAVWSYVSSGVTKATQSLVGNSALVTKVYFPRLLVPISALIPGLIDLGVALVALAAFMLAYGVAPTIAVLTLPLWLIAAMAVVLGAGLVLGTLNVTYRDVNQGIALLVQLWLFVTPVAYPSSIVPRAWRALYFLNPVAGVVEGFRWALVGYAWPGTVALVSLATTALLLLTGVVYFEHTERRFADVI
jgi:lipopolysaccharide transport system permease protein